MAKRFLLTTLLFAALTVAVTAQPNLNFKRVATNWPTVELYFSVGCSGTPAYNMTKQNLRVFENGVEVNDFALSCPDPTQRCAISVALVFDGSGSMAGAGNAGAKAAGRAFVDIIDGVLDQVSIIWFNAQVTVQQQMTTLKPLLYSALEALPTGGFTAIWDGCYRGVEEVALHGTNPCRGVILLGDGEDNSSSRTPQEIIDLANQHHVRVYTVGLGSNINATELEMIALLTGGRYYHTPNAGQLAAIYQEISTIMFQGFQECTITYESDCSDGAMRDLELQLVNFCGGSDVKVKGYRAPMDSTTFSGLQMEIGDATVNAGSEVSIPLNLLAPPGDRMFYPFSFSLLFDQQCVSFVGVNAPTGALLEGVPLDISPVPGGVRIETTDRKLLGSIGELMEFTFRASRPNDTTCCNIQIADAAFEQGCFLPVVAAGQICILPGAPLVTCEPFPTFSFVWDRALGSYNPNPFQIRGRFFNSGDRRAKNTRFKITYDDSVFSLMTPSSDEQVAVPADIDTGSSVEVEWIIQVKPQSTGDTTDLCITAMFDNHEDVTCCAQIYIPPAEPILECALDIPIITADTEKGMYAPMPFPVTVTVTNSGGLQTDSVFATIIVPPDLSLAANDAPDNHTKRVLPAILSASQVGTAMWMVKHPRALTEKQYTIQVWVKTSNADSSLCEAVVTIPPLTTPLSATITPEGALAFCEGKSVVLDAGSGYEKYLWSRGDTTQKILVNQSGSYWAQVWDASGQTATSDTVVVTVYPLPPKPVIRRSGDSLITDPAAQYVWIKDSALIPGADEQAIVLNDVGEYAVIVYNAEGCENTSDPFIVDVLDAEFPVPGLFAVDIFPQPGTGTLNLRFNSTQSELVDITAYDLLGRAVYSSDAFRIAGLHTFTIETDGWGRGIYYLRINHGGENTIRAVQIR
ncbi:VWA domain-containing protein [bacterium]|nr:VWA domain-containing protein [bacterium]